jgi:transcriptional regulator with XRE-family HTH domain
MPSSTTKERIRFARAFGKWFLEARKKHGLSQSGAARLFETTEATIRAWERGQVPDGYTLMVIFDKFGRPKDGVLRVFFDGFSSSFDLMNA